MPSLTRRHLAQNARSSAAYLAQHSAAKFQTYVNVSASTTTTRDDVDRHHGNHNDDNYPYYYYYYYEDYDENAAEGEGVHHSSEHPSSHTSTGKPAASKGCKWTRLWDCFTLYDA